MIDSVLGHGHMLNDLNTNLADANLTRIRFS
jgi:hypothetical protein